MISGNKFSDHPLELYSKRLEAIRWFERNHPGDFGYYGILWDKIKTDKSPVYMFLKRFKLLVMVRRLFLRGLNLPYYMPKRTTVCYGGEVASKIEVMRRYRFSICYENSRDFPGYITEKIFDSFFANCVPVYWGAPNIGRYVGEDCFIDKRNFKSYKELHSYLADMGEEEYLRYQRNICDFLSGPGMDPFRHETLVDELDGHIVDMVVRITGEKASGAVDSLVT